MKRLEQESETNCWLKASRMFKCVRNRRGGGTLSSCRTKLWGYTLAEIVVVMLIIAVVVAVTIGITKAKLNNVVSYTYYNAYSTLRSISTEMLADWNPKDLEYKQAYNFDLKNNRFFANFFQPVYAYQAEVLPPIDSGCKPPSGWDGGTESFGTCPSGTVWDSFNCKCMPKEGEIFGVVCPDGSIAGSLQLCSQKPGVTCPDGSTATSLQDCFKVSCWDGSLASSASKCPPKVTCWDGSFATSQSKCPACTNKPSKIPCGQSWDEKTCSLSGTIKTCPSGYFLNMTNCTCDKNPNADQEIESRCDSGFVVINGVCKFPCWNGTYELLPGRCPPKFTCWDGSQAPSEGACPPSVTCWDGTKTGSYSDCPPCTNKPDTIPCGQSWDESTCSLTGSAKTCPSGQHLNSSCNCISTCPANPGCGKICNNETGIISDLPGFSKECSDETYEWSEEQCKCIPSPRTLPRKGENFCKLFERHANIMSGSEVCSGSVISNGTTNFADKSPDITLRNGLRVYNMHSDARAISDLANNTQGGSYDGVPNTNSYGYTVYVDIDGSRGDSQLWSDVYPFYITLSGKIIPAYDSANPEQSGGDSVRHMQVSVENENYNSGRRSIKWLAKSVPFKEGACIAGYVGDSTPYCKNGTSYTQAVECTSNINSFCRVKQIQPVKFFF